jgi:hypothetical protein
MTLHSQPLGDDAPEVHFEVEDEQLSHNLPVRAYQLTQTEPKGPKGKHLTTYESGDAIVALMDPQDYVLRTIMDTRDGTSVGPFIAKRQKSELQIDQKSSLRKLRELMCIYR